MSKIKAETGGKVIFDVAEDAYDPNMLSEVLSRTAKNPVQVENGKITVDASDAEDIKVMLATIGLEVLKETAENAEPEGGADAGDQGGEVEAAKKAKVKAAAADNASQDAVSEDQLYDSADKEIAASSEVSLVHANSKNGPCWLIIADGNPVARINLKAQDHAASISAYFGTENYQNSIIEAFQKVGVAKTLQTVKAEVFVDEAVTPAEEPDVEAIKASAVDHFRHCFDMGIIAAQKNVIENPLKIAAWEVLAEQNVEDPEAVIEAIFAAMPDFVKSVEARADKYLAMDASGLKATEETLNEMGIQPVSAKSSHVSAEAQKHRAALTTGSSPLTVPGAEAIHAQQYTTGSENDLRSVIKAAKVGRRYA